MKKYNKGINQIFLAVVISFFNNTAVSAASLKMGVQDINKNPVLTSTKWTIWSGSKKIKTAKGSVLFTDLPPGKYTVKAKAKDGRSGKRNIIINGAAMQSVLIVN